MFPRQLAVALAATLAAVPLSAQQSAAQADFRWEKALAAGSVVRVSNLNGNVVITAGDVQKVSVVGVKRGRNPDEVTVEVVEHAEGITVCAVFTEADMECNESGARMHEGRRRGWRDDDWDEQRVDLQVTIPRALQAIANSISGDVRIIGAEGDIRAGSVSGDIRLENVRATSVRASSVSGDVDATIAALNGTGDLRFNSVSGNVTAELPPTLHADVTMRSVSGSLDSDFPLTLNGRMSRHRLEARIGNGGRDLEVHTVSGDVRLRTRRPE